MFASARQGVASKLTPALSLRARAYFTSTTRNTKSTQKPTTGQAFRPHLVQSTRLSARPAGHMGQPTKRAFSCTITPTTRPTHHLKPAQTPTTLAHLAKLNPTHTPPAALQSSLLVTALVGALCGVTTAVLSGAAWQADRPVTTFADIEKILAQPDPDPYTFGASTVDELARKAPGVREFSKNDYALVISIPEETMPIREKIDALRQILLRHIHQTYPIYNLIESKSSYINATIFDNIYLRRTMEAKLLHRALQLPLDQVDVKDRTQHDGVRQILNPEQLHHLRQNLTMLHDKCVHDFPTREQSEYLNDNELRQVYNELAEFAMVSCVKLNYYKFVALLYNLENVVDDDRQLFDRLDTTVTTDHNLSGNAFTEVVDGMPQLTLLQRAILYRNKAMEVISTVLSETEFLIDAIPQINDAIKTNLKSEVYRFAQAKLEGPDDTLDTEELDRFVESELEKTRIEYKFVSQFHNELYHRWLMLSFTNEERIGMMGEEELDNLYRSLRNEYLGAKAQEHTPKAFLDTYEVMRPLEYNELYNQAYLLLDPFDIEKPLAEAIMQENLRVDSERAQL